MRPTPTNKENYIIELTSEQLDTLRDAYRYSGEGPYIEMLYSPHWEEHSLSKNGEK